MTAKNAKFAITTQSGRSVVKEFTSYAEAQKYADKHFGRGSIVQMVGNSRACNSQNPVVRNAMNAAGVKGGNYEVTLETVTLKGNSTSSTTMTDAQLKAWLVLIHQGGIYSEAISRFARGEKYYDANIDMHPSVHIRMI